MTEIIICSFYTGDDYYKTKQVELCQRLDELTIEYQVRQLPIPDGMVWSNICRKKIGFLADVCREFPQKKVFWIDVDCSLDYLPEFVRDFSSDIIGFARGFSSPMKVGYHFRARFWEPCFLGINTTERGRKFIRDAEQMEKKFIGNATDDFFFEESWRKNCDEISYQIIPSCMRVGVGDESGFFQFGESGNVSEFKSVVAQHDKMYSTAFSPRVMVVSLLTRLGLYSPAKKVYLGLRRRYRELAGAEGSSLKTLITKKRLKTQLIVAAVNNDVLCIDRLRGESVGFDLKEQQKLMHQADAILEYRNFHKQKKPIPLCWWFDPEPGNFGDWLSPYIVSRIADRGVQLVPPSKMHTYANTNMVCVGSIGKFINKNSIVIGTGISRKATEVNADALYLAVRGPITGKALETSGGKDPGVYGDPAIVMPKLLPKMRKETGKAGFVRHFSHLKADILLPNDMEEISIYASRSVEIERFIEQLLSCEYVVTSAMHCYILCHAYGIPSALVVFEGFENEVAGDGIKYLDYAEGVGVEPVVPAKVPANLSEHDFAQIVRNIKIKDEVISDMYELLKENLSDNVVDEKFFA